MKVIDSNTKSWQILRVVFVIDLCQASNEKPGKTHHPPFIRHINKVQAKQYHPISLSFCKNFGDQTESALPLLKLFEAPLAANNVHSSWHKSLLPSLFSDVFLIR